MKILLTNLTLAGRTGTEVVTRDLALGLVRAGHVACVFSPRLGPIAGEISAAGVAVVSRLDEVPFRPDIIHGHHHVETTVALLHFHDVPAIFVCHDRLSWHDTPPPLEAIRRYVAVDRNCLERLLTEAGVQGNRTRLILNAVDLLRFRQRRPLPAKPARALVFSNYAAHGADLQTLRRACEDAGLELTVLGSGVAAQADRPEDVIGNYDLVFAKARCALEALAAGCAVILYDWQGLGPIVTSADVAELRSWNFGMRCLQRRLTTGAVKAEIARYDPLDAARVTRLIRCEASLDKAVADYVNLYKEALADSGAVRVSVGDALDALARKVNSLESLLRAAAEPFAMPPLPREVQSGISLGMHDVFGRIAPGESAEISVEIDNRSAEMLASVPPYPVHVSYHWLDAASRRCAEFEGERTQLSVPVRPRSRHLQKMRVLAPREPGRYVLIVTLVQEQQFWFDQLPRPVAAQVEVTVEHGVNARLRTLRDVASRASDAVVRDGEFASLGFISDPQEGMLTFVESRRFAARAAACPQTACVLTRPELIDSFPERIGIAVADDPRRRFFEIHNLLATETDFYGCDVPSSIHETARLHPRCWIDPKNVIIGPGVTVGPNACVLGRAVLGDSVVVHAGAVIGSAGFQTSHRSGNPIEMVHAGTVEVGANCHIFANAVVARGLFRQSTRIGKRCRIGNNAFVSHNCVLGDEVFVGHGAVVNGNVHIGANAWIGPGATIVHAIRIAEAAQVSLGSTVVRDIEPGKRVTGLLAMEHNRMLRLWAAAERGKWL